MLKVFSWNVRGFNCCVGGDFNVLRFPSERSTGGRMSSAMFEFSGFIDSCNFIDFPLEGANYSWSSTGRSLCYHVLIGFCLLFIGIIISK